MGRDLATLRAIDAAKKTGGKRQDLPQGGGDEDEGPVPPALKKLRQEAADRGATLATGGKGGLPSEVVLDVMRRDGYRCKKCGGNQGLTVHHKAHLENPSPALRHLADVKSKTDPDSLVTLCEECHDDVHDEDRAGGTPDPRDGQRPGGGPPKPDGQ